MLAGDQSRFPLLTPNWDKRYLDTSANYDLPAHPQPVSMIFFLGGEAESRQPDELLRRATPGEALRLLSANTLGSFVLDRDGRRREFEYLSTLAKHVPSVVLGSARRKIPLNALVEVVRNALRDSPAALPQVQDVFAQRL
jgi:hypothetical protein